MVLNELEKRAIIAKNEKNMGIDVVCGLASLFVLHYANITPDKVSVPLIRSAVESLSDTTKCIATAAGGAMFLTSIIDFCDNTIDLANVKVKGMTKRFSRLDIDRILSSYQDKETIKKGR